MAAALCLVLSPAAHSAILDVSTTGDSVDANIGDGICADASGFCSLRAAVQESNALPGPDKINLPSGVYMLSLTGTGETFAAAGDLNVTDDLWISGLGSSLTEINGNGTDRVLDVQTGNFLQLSSLQVRNGATAGSGSGINASGTASLVLDEVAVVQNIATGSAGGIRLSSGTAELTNVTVSGNSAASGGGLSVGGGIVTLTNVTIANNTGVTGQGGIRVGGGGFVITNSMVALNPGGDCGGSIGPSTASLDSDGSCGFGGPGNLPNTNPLLNALQDNGGPSFTHTLQPGSPAIDTGNNPSCPPIDQRGAGRPQDGDGDSSLICDIGAVEQFPFPVVPGDLQITKDDGVPSYLPGGQVIYTISAANVGLNVADSVRVIDDVTALPQVQSASWTCVPANGATCTSGPVAGDIADLIDLPLGGIATYTLTVNIAPTATGDLVNTAHVIEPFWFSELDNSNNTAVDTDTQAALPTLDLSGSIYEDINGDAGLGDAVGRSGVTLRLYADDGDGNPNAGDNPPVATQITDGSGGFTFSGTGDLTTYWLVVDSSSVSPSSGGSGVAEQTYGPEGALCTNGIAAEAILTHVTAGPCYAGRRANTHDDFDIANNAEHIARVEVAGSNITGLDFAFSFNVVTRIADVSEQGTLRRFFENARTINGANAMRFVPVVPTNATGASGNWWEVDLAATLPDLDDQDTTVDGTAYNLNSPASTLGFNSAISEVTTGPELVIDVAGVGFGRGLGIRADGVVVQHVGVIDAQDGSGHGIDIIGPAAQGCIVRDSTITGHEGSGILVRDVTNGLQILNNVIRDNAISVNDGIRLEESNDAIISGNAIVDNAGFGIELEDPLFGSPCDNNMITNNIIRGNGLGVSSEDAGIAIGEGNGNTVSLNTITGNAGDGIVVHNGTQNTITRNSIHGNGELGIDIGPANSGDGVTLNDDGDGDGDPNERLNFPVLESASINGGNLTLRGWARPDSIIEFFVTAVDPTGFGEGETFLLTLDEDSGADTDSGTSGYGPGLINGLVQGQDTTARFEFVVPTPLGVSVGTAITATATDGSGNTSEFSGRVFVGGGVDLSITKDNGQATYAPGGTLTYAIVVSNLGPSNAVDVSVTDTFDGARLTNLNWSCVATGSADCGAATSGTTDISVGDADIAAGAGNFLTYTVTADVLISATGDLVNTATVSANNETDPVPANNSATDTDTLTSEVDLGITKNDGQATYTPGGSTTYAIVVSNAGPSNAVNASVADTFDVTRLTNLNWGCVATGTADCGATTSGTTDISVGDVDIAAGAGNFLTYTITADVLAGSTGNLVNTASVTANNETDSLPADNSATDTDTLDIQTDLSITKDDGVASYTPGGNVSYTIVVGNAGPSDATGVTVADAVAALPQVSTATWTCVAVGGATCTSGPTPGDINDTIDLPVGGTATYTLSVGLGAAATGDLVNTATVTASGVSTDPNPANDSATDTDTSTSPVADLSLTKTVDNALPNVGSSIVFTVTVDNGGPSAATGVVIQDLLPSGYTYAGDVAGTGVYDSGTGIWTVGAVPAGSSATLNISATVNPSGNHLNTAEITAASQADPDSTPGNGIGNGEDDEASRGTTPTGTDGTIDITDSSMPGDTLSVIVDDADLDANPAGTESLQTTVTNDSTGETETITLTETGPATGVFQGTLATIYGSPAGTDNDGVLNTRGGDLVSTTYLDELTSDPAQSNQLRSDQGVVLGGDGAALTITPSSAPGDTLALQVTDSDPNVDAGAVEAVQVSVLNEMTLETEGITLTETGTNTGVFQATLLTAIAAAGGPNNDGTLNTRAGDTLMASYIDTPDGTGGTSTVTATGVVGVVDAILLSKQAWRIEVMVGGLVPYVVRAQNTTAGNLLGIVLSDRPPAGLKIVEGSASLVRSGADLQLGTPDDIITAIVPLSIRPLDFGPFDFAAGEAIEVRYSLRVGSGALLGETENRAAALLAGTPMSNTARAIVTVIPDPVLDQSTIIGKVFEDTNRDGVQDAGETGVGKAMVVLDDGTYALTDAHGRYHFPAVAHGQRMLKINLHSLPPGASPSIDESHVVWITPGLPARVNFGIVVPQHVETIGRPRELGVEVSGEPEHHPLEFVGKAESLSLLVNDSRIPLDATDVRLRLQTVDEIVVFTGDTPADPLEFEMSVETGSAISRWKLTVLDAEEHPVRTLGEEGSPPAELAWDGRDETGEPIAAGDVYLYQLEVSHPDGTWSASTRRIFGVNRNTIVALELTGNAFDVGDATLSENAKEMLEHATEILNEYPEERIIVGGHTDSRGTDATNVALSRSRAEAAAAYLIDELGFPEERILTEWYGESRPSAPNELEEGREINRRVEVKAEIEEIESAEITDRYRASPEVRINGSSVELGKHGRFHAKIEPGQAAVIDVEMNDSHGGSVRAAVAVPRLEIASPRGVSMLSELREANGCRLDGDTVVCRLEVITDPGNAVSLDSREVAPGINGRITLDLPLEVGTNVFGLLARNAGGISRSANLTIEVRDRDVDGNVLVLTEAIPNLAVNLPAEGAQVAESSFAVSGSTDAGNRVWANERELEIGPEGGFDAVVELPAGKSRLVLRVEDPQGRSGAIEREVEVAHNQLFLMAFADGEFGKLQASGAVDGIENADEFYSEGRLAFYLKGRIRGKYLITAAFDSGREELGDLFSDLSGDESDRLLSNLDPDKFYPVYGDDSSVVYDVESQGKLYLALDSEQIQAVVGNYPLNLNDTELAAYQRTLYGARAVYRSASRSKFGDPNTEVVVFAAEVRHTHVRDELRATGGSLYYLSHRDVVEGSEEITFVVRDKHTGLVLTRTVQRQNVDYTIKYEEGRLMFHRTVSSVEQDGSLVDSAVLSGHPVFIQADYETVADGFDKTASGGRVRKQLGDHVAVGGTYIQDELGVGSYELAGADAEFRPTEGTRVTVEYADSSGTDSLTFVSDDGGLSYTPMTSTGLEEGSAWKAAVELDVGSWFGRPDRQQVDVYFKELDDGFFSSGNFLERGSQKTGIHGSFAVTERDTIQLRHDREDKTGLSATPGAADETVLSSVQWRHQRERWRLAVEYLADEVQDSNGSSLRDSSLGAARFWTRITKKLAASLEHQSTLSGPDNDQTTAGLEYRALPHLALELKGTDGDNGSSSQAGAVWTVGESEIYVNERLSDDAAGEKTATILGARSRLGESSKVYTEYQVEDDSGGGRTISLVGLQRQWEPAKGFRFLLSGESSDMDAATTKTRRSTVGASVTFQNESGLTLTSRNELRRESGDSDRDQYVTFSRADYRFNDDLTLLAKYRYSKTEDTNTALVEAKLDERSVGLAYRPTKSDRFNSLAQYTRLLDFRPTAAAETSGAERTMDVISFETLFQISPRLEWITKSAARFQEEQVVGVSPMESDTYLAIQRFNMSVWRPVDLGFELRGLQQRQADDLRLGWLSEVMWNLQKNFRAGIGYNFTDFSDNEFSQNDYSTHGWFLRVQGRY